MPLNYHSPVISLFSVLGKYRLERRFWAYLIKDLALFLLKGPVHKKYNDKFGSQTAFSCFYLRNTL